MAFHLLEDDETAEECENDTCLAAWQSIQPHEPRDYYYPLLARLLRHIALNRCGERKCLKRFALVCGMNSELEECLAACLCIAAGAVEIWDGRTQPVPGPVPPVPII